MSQNYSDKILGEVVHIIRIENCKVTHYQKCHCTPLGGAQHESAGGEYKDFLICAEASIRRACNKQYTNGELADMPLVYRIAEGNRRVAE